MSKPIEQLADLLKQRGIMACVAESCTGGLLAGALTDLSGSSAYFDRGFVTYSNEAKHELLGVPMALIEAHGAVSAEVAAAMAEGALEKSRADLALSITGIAGPVGGSDEKPVGTVYIGLAGKNGVQSVHHLFKGDRAEIRAQTVDAALSHMIEQLS